MAGALALLLARSPVASAVDADATAFIARNSTAPTTEQAAIYNYFAVQAKAIGAWPYITDCGFLCAQDATTARLGFKNTINPALVGTGHVHTPGYGYVGGGTGALDLGYKFPVGQQDDAHLAVYTYGSTASDNGDAGNANSAIVVQASGTTDTCVARINSAANTVGASLDGTGFYIANRTATASKLGLRDGDALASLGTSQSPDQTYSLWVMGRNGASPQYSARLVHFWSVGTGMPDATRNAYALLVEKVCAALTASYTTISNVTPKTKALYRYMIEMTRQSNYLLGVFDNTYWPVVAKPNTLTEISAMTSGQVPALTTIEWADPLREDASAATEAAAQLARIRTAYAAGSIISINYHSGNPSTGTLERMPTLTIVSGADKDTTGDAVTAVLAGGSKRTQFLAFCDRFATFCNTCTDAGGEPIPLIVRMFHEINGFWFWWNGQAGTAQLFRDFVDRMRLNNVANVLFDFNINTGISWSSFFPGTSYCDFISADHYDHSGSSPGLSSGRTDFDALLALGRKPTHFAEIGYDGSNGSATVWRDGIGYYHRDRLRRSSHFAPWHSLHMPLSTDTAATGYGQMVADTACITRARLPAVYSKTEGLAPYVPLAPSAPVVAATSGILQNVISLTTASIPNGATVTGYTIYRSLTPGGAQTTVATNVSLPYTDTGRTGGTTYYYKVAGVNSAGTGTQSAEVSATPAAAAAAPGAPVVAATAGNAQNIVSLTTPAAANGATVTGYTIYRSLTSGGAQTTVATNVTLPYSDTGLTNGTAYFYKAAGVNSVGTGTQSAEVTATPSLSSIFASDTFTKADGTDIVGSVPDVGGAWALHYLDPTYTTSGGPGAGEIQSGRVLALGTVGPLGSGSQPRNGLLFAQLTTTAPAADYSVKITIDKLSTVAGDNVGVGARMQTGVDTFYWARYNTGSAAVQLYSTKAGTSAQIGSNYAATFTDGTSADLEIIVSGTTPTTLTVKWKGSVVIGPINDPGSPITAAGQAGIRLNNANSGTTTLPTGTTGMHITSIVATT